MANHKKLNLNADQLRELYSVQRLSQDTIAKMFNVSQVTVANYLLRYGIPTRGFCGKQIVFLDKEELQRLYGVEQWTMEAIAKHFDCGESTVRHNLIRYGLMLSGEENLRRRMERNKERYTHKMVHKGYAHTRVPDHPEADKAGYVPDHRLSAEKVIGRSLGNGEIVHHINFRKRDNDPSNLAVMGGNDHHRVHHYMGRVAVYLLGLTTVRPEPLTFKAPVFWGGKYVTSIDLIADSDQVTQSNSNSGARNPTLNSGQLLN